MKMLLAAALLLAVGAQAAPVRLEDVAQRARAPVVPRWVHEGEAGSPDRVNAMVAEAPNLEVRLNTTRFVGAKQARVFLVFPGFVPGVRSPSGIRAEWRTRGVLLPGAATPGTRTLVYDGPITQSFLADTLDLTLFLDARFLDLGVRFEPTFEIEPGP